MCNGGETGIVYEFHGCVYHGCPLCFDQANDYPSYSERKMDDACQETIRWEERLQMLGFTVESIWEHNYKTLRETDEMQLFS